MSTKKDERKALPANTRIKKKNVEEATTAKIRDRSVDKTTVKKTTGPKVASVRKPKEKPAEQPEKLKHHVAPQTIKPPAKRVSQRIQPKKPSTVPNSSRDAPGTPVSTRVTKSQFFPSKNMYTNAIKRDPKSTVLKPKKKTPEIKEVSSDNSSTSERPRTATLRKGSIVNHNIVGPDAPKVARTKSIITPRKPEPKEETYEDDFESYESDFEKYSSESSSSSDLNLSQADTSTASSSSTSEVPQNPNESKRVSSAGTDEERKLDSGNYELSSDYKHKQILDNIKEAIEKENASKIVEQNAGASLSDEGFDEGKSMQYINFLGAQKKNEHRKSMEIKRKRGEEILSMIHLDTFSFTLFDLPPVPYDDFIKRYGRSNTIQTFVQTGDDDVSEETQTDSIVFVNKTTQHPPTFDNPTAEQLLNLQYNENHLTRFVSSASQLILNLLTRSKTVEAGKIVKNPRDIPFTDCYTKFNTSSVGFLQNCNVRQVVIAPNNPNVLLTLHRKTSSEDGYKSVLCLWDILNTEQPKVFLLSRGETCCCCFGFQSTELVFGGITDGTICIWNTNLMEYQDNLDNVLALVPCFTTEIGQGHNAKIVGLQSFQDRVDRVMHFEMVQTNEILSLDEDGELLVWDVYANNKQNHQKGLTKWEKVVIVTNSDVSLRKLHPDLSDLQCTDLIISENYVYVSTNYGYIVHYVLNGARNNVRKFLPETQLASNCLEACPFSPNYFLAGFSDGNVSLYSRNVEKPLMVLSNKDSSVLDANIEIIQWSKNKPFVFYTKDYSNALHIWDLSESDIYPVYSVPFDEDISCMDLSPYSADGKQRSYMILGTKDGQLYLHFLNKEHGVQVPEVYQKHKTTFLNYVNRL